MPGSAVKVQVRSRWVDVRCPTRQELLDVCQGWRTAVPDGRVDIVNLPECGDAVGLLHLSPPESPAHASIAASTRSGPGNHGQDAFGMAEELLHEVGEEGRGRILCHFSVVGEDA